MPPFDFGALSKPTSFLDYQRLNDQFQQQKQLMQSQIAGGQIDQQTKALQLAGQIVGNSTDQASYDKTRAYAQSAGVPTGFLPDQFDPNVINRLRYFGATPTAQLSAMLQGQQMALKAGKATGNIEEYGYHGLTQPDMQPQSYPTGNPNIQANTPAGNAAIVDLYGDGSTQPVPMPAKGETTAAYTARTKNDPDIIAANAKAKQQGADAAKNQLGATESNESVQRLSQGLDALDQLNTGLPSAEVLPVSIKAEFDKRNPLSNHSQSSTYNQFQQINQQTIINGLSQLVKSGQIRGNQFIEKIISRGYAVDPDADIKTRAAEINNLRNELSNINTSAQNIAGKNQGYTPILNPPGKINPADAINELKRRGKI